VKNPFRRKALEGSGDAVGALRSPGWNPYPLLGGGAQQRINDIFNRAQSANYGWMYANSPAVRTVIDVLVRNVGQLDLRLYEEVDEAERSHAGSSGGAEPALPERDDDIGRLHPVAVQGLPDLRQRVRAADAGGERQLTLMRIPAFMVVVEGRSLFDADVYRVWTQGAYQSGGCGAASASRSTFTPDQIMHWHGEHPLDPRIGLSHLDTLRDVIAEDAALQQATVELANAGCRSRPGCFGPVTRRNGRMRREAGSRRTSRTA
jgi:hypothetical protein